VTDILLRKVQAPGAQGDNGYDVIGADGIVIGRIFKATTSPAGTTVAVDAGLRGAREPNADTRLC
jgi:hypothetical protein